MTPSARPAMPQATAPLRSLLPLLLPAPIGVEDCTLSGEPSPETAGFVGVAAATRRAPPPHLPAREHFLLFPAYRAPRALLPVAPLRTERQALLPLRSGTAQPLQRLAQTVACSLPRPAIARLTKRVLVATAAESETVARLRAKVPGARLGAVLSPPDFPRGVLLGFDESGAPVLAAKGATSGGEVARLEREWRTLRVAHQLTRLRASIPTPEALFETHLGKVLLTGGVSGSPAPERIDERVGRWLEACRLDGSVRFGDTELVQRLRASLTKPDALRERMRIAVERSLDHLADTFVPNTLVHGDFVRWNLFVSGDGLRVIDWEHGSVRGVPGWDAAYFHLQVGLIRRGWGVDELAASIETLTGPGLAFYGHAGRAALAALVLADSVARYETWRDRAHVETVVAAIDVILRRADIA